MFYAVDIEFKRCTRKAADASIYFKLFYWVSTHTHTPVPRPFFQDYPGEPAEPVPERLNQSGFYWSKRQWVAVASAGPYASLHLAPDR